MKQIIDYVTGLKVGEVQRYKNMAIAPLMRKGKSSLDYLVLEEALKQGLRVEEERNRTVPHLFIENKTGKEVLIVYGEIIEGGSQHRAVDANAYLAKGFSGKIPVKCVEAHRWETGKACFMGAVNVMPVRGRAVLAKGQSETWAYAEHTLGAHNVRSVTSSLKEVHEQKSGDMEDYLKHFSLVGQVGNVVAIITQDRTIYGVELFDKPETFSKMHKKLMESYILDALLGKGEISLTKTQAKEFLSKANNCNFNKVEPVSLGEDYRINGEGINGSALFYQNAVYFNMATVDGSKYPHTHPGEEIPHLHTSITRFSTRYR